MDGVEKPMPTGVVTLLMTDVQGSTLLWERHPSQMPQVMTRHHQIIHAQIERHGGRRPEDQGEGDSVVAVFPRPSAAVACALECQRALVCEPWPETLGIRVRMALHTGDVVLHGERNYYGANVNRTARLRSAAHGGQVLISVATADLVDEDLPSGVILKDLGSYRLKDIGRPERVYQLCHPDLPADFPPLKTAAAPTNNLPVAHTSFVGREGELPQLRSLLASSSLVTLTGVGGVGKTRLSLAIAAECLSEFDDGVWFVELAHLDDSAALGDAVAAVLGLAPQPGRPMAEVIIEALRPRNLLLILDNCEHLLDGVARLVSAILAASPDVTIMTTSREGLGLEAERVWTVPSLVTDQGAPSAVTLFVDRARSVVPGFEVGTAHDKVVELCGRLDGIPLAIELAAARMRSMTLAQVLEHLDERFRLLSGGRRSLERHQTLRHAVRWSYDLLSDQERLVLCQSSVFAGGFDLNAAIIVCGVGALDDLALLDLLDSLARKSLLLVERTGDSVRYGLLETIRLFAEEELAAVGQIEETRDRHAAFFADEAERNFQLMRSPNALQAQQWIEREIPNLRAAFRWALSRSDLDVAIRLSAHSHEIARFSLRYETLGWCAEVAGDARRIGHRSLPLLLTMASDSSWSLGRLEEAKAFGREAISLIGNDQFDEIIWAFVDLAMISAFEGDVEAAIAFARTGAELPADQADHFCQAAYLYVLSLGSKDEAMAIADQVLESAEATGIPMTMLCALIGKASAFADADPPLALASLERAYALARDTGNRFYVGGVMPELAARQARSGDAATALRSFEELLFGWQLAGDQFLVIGMGNLVVLFERLNRPAAAATLYGALTRDVSLDAMVAGLPEVVELLKQTLGPHEFARCCDRGSAMTLKDAGAMAQQEIGSALTILQEAVS